MGAHTEEYGKYRVLTFQSSAHKNPIDRSTDPKQAPERLFSNDRSDDLRAGKSITHVGQVRVRSPVAGPGGPFRGTPPQKSCYLTSISTALPVLARTPANVHSGPRISKQHC
jgi:hypothetical protein